MVAGYTYRTLSMMWARTGISATARGLPQNAHNPELNTPTAISISAKRLTFHSLTQSPAAKATVKRWKVGRINSIITLETPQYWGPMDEGTDAAGVGPLPVSPPRTARFAGVFTERPQTSSSEGRLEFPTSRTPRTRPVAAQALAVDGGTAGASTASLNLFGCYAMEAPLCFLRRWASSVTWAGTCSRTTVSGTSISRWPRISILEKPCGSRFRAEFFNIFNHPNFANPYGGQNGFGLNDPSVSPFRLCCATPDIAAANPAVGSGGPRSVQLGLKFTF